MPSLVTSIIGGVQGASASHNAANAVKAGYDSAGNLINTAVDKVNPTLTAAGDTAAGMVGDASNYAQQAALDTARAGSQGVTDAANAARTGMDSAVTGANAYLDPYISSGADATRKLSDLADSKFTFSQDDPSYQFRLQQGQQALERSAAASGSATGGAAAKALARYGQGMASTEYQNAFNRFQANRNSQAGILSDLSGRGLNASGAAGSNLVTGARYGGDITTDAAKYGGTLNENAAQYAGTTGLNAAEYGGNMKYKATSDVANNELFRGKTLADFATGKGQAQAAGDMGAASAWNGMLSGIGNAANSALFGGFGGGGGFSMSGAMSGVPSGWQPRGWTTGGRG